MADFCRKVGFSDDIVRKLLAMQPVLFSGELYSNEFYQHFKTTDSEARLERDPKRPGFFNLFIDRIPIIDWFRQKYADFRQAIGIPIKSKDELNLSRSKSIGQ